MLKKIYFHTISLAFVFSGLILVAPWAESANMCHKHLGDSINSKKGLELKSFQSLDEFEIQLKKAAIDSFKTTLRTPTLREISEIVGVKEFLIDTFIDNPSRLIHEAISENEGDVIQDIRNLLIKSYLRTLSQRDVPEAQRTQSKTPSLEQLFHYLPYALTKRYSHIKNDIAFGRFTFENFKNLFRSEQNGPLQFLPPIFLFSDPAQLELLARQKAPNAFKNFLSSNIYNVEGLEHLTQAFSKRQGFFITSITAGIPLNEAQFTIMLKAAKELNYDIIVIPAMKQLNGIDQRLVDHPRVHILTHTFENDSLVISNVGIGPRQMNPLASLDKPGLHLPGQTILYGHDQQVHKHVATRTNIESPTALWTTGSLSVNLHPTRLPIQDRAAYMAKGVFQSGFLVVEKADALSGFTQRGSENSWHTRQIEFASDFDVEGFETAGFSDMHHRFYIEKPSDPNKETFEETDVISSNVDMRRLTLGDLHEYLSNQNFLLSIADFIKKNETLEEIFLHDPIDGISHNHHEAKRIQLLRKRFARGELDYHHEMMRLVQFVNALHTIRPDIKITIVDSNHSYWGRNLAADGYKNDLQQILNGEFLNELRFAGEQIYGVTDPLTYIFNYRNDFISRLPGGIRDDMIERMSVVKVLNPEKIQVLTAEQYITGPAHREDHKENHGHEGANGAQRLPKSTLCRNSKTNWWG